MGPIEKAYGKIKHFCLPAGTKHDLDVWMTGIRIAKVCNHSLPKCSSIYAHDTLIHYTAYDNGQSPDIFLLILVFGWSNLI